MAKQETRKRSSGNAVSGKKVKQSIVQTIHRKETKPGNGGINLYFRLGIAVILCVTCAFVFILWQRPNFNSDNIAYPTPKKNKAENIQIKPKRKHENLREKKEPNQEMFDSELYKNFKPHILNRLRVKSTNVDGKTIKVKALEHGHRDSTVRAYVLENFLSEHECEALSAAHDSHVTRTSRLHPLLCFDSVKTFRQNVQEVGLKMQVSNADFLHGTTCINESLSLLVRKHGMKWSYSTSFYPGESKFSLTLQERIKETTGLAPENGGRFQITSYPRNVGYKNHTDCVVGLGEKRDRFATILVYLKDVAVGGETGFPQLDLSVTPKKGLALVWNSMNKDGECDPSSIHNAAQVIQGHKYILQRWYYYQNFPSLGIRIPEPLLPRRKTNQPRVSCDQYEFGSCRWYDEWNYDHIKKYVQNQHKYV